MGIKRSKNKHLPTGVYESRGKLYYVPRGTKKWQPLPDGLKTWAKIVEGAGKPDCIAALWTRYELEVLGSKAAKTQRNRRQEWGILEPVFGHMAPAELEPHHVWSYFRARGENEAAKHEIRCLSAIMTFARQVGAISHPNPCFGLQLKSKTGGRRDRYVTDEEFLAVQSIAPRMVALAMDLALITGMSQVDVLSLDLRQEVPEGILFDRRKTGKGQLIEWNDDLRRTVEAAQRVSPRVRRTLICTRGGLPFTSQGFQTAWQRLMARAIRSGKLANRFTFHDLRAKNLSEAATLEEAQKRGGHSSSAVTQRHYRRLPVRAPALKILGKA